MQSLEVALKEQRVHLADQIKEVKDLASQGKAAPEVATEIYIAKRHLEDARMRLGVALAYAEGQEPFANRS